MRVTVLGSGPAGMFAAHAAIASGHECQVLTKNREPSTINGAQYLHEPIPDLSLPEKDRFMVGVMKLGTEYNYYVKSHGFNASDESWSSSWQRYAEGEHEAWPLDTTYSRAFETYGQIISEKDVRARDIPDLIEDCDLLVVTIPRPLVCHNRDHNFEKQIHWISAGFFQMPPNSIIYNGLKSSDATNGWHRASNIGERADDYWPALEWGFPIPNAAYLIKPQGTDCDCWTDDGVVFSGRYGKWDPLALTHEAWSDTMSALGS